MTDLFWPGDERAGDHFSPLSLLEAVVRVESAWLETMVAARLFPLGAAADLEGLVSQSDVDLIASNAEAAGNPVIAFLDILRQRVPPATALWLHRGLTSQDVLDTALMICARSSAHQLEDELARQIATLGTLADTHRATVMTGRTLTRPATPITFGLKAANWLHGVLDARDRLIAARAALAGQFGGAAGTLGAVTQLAGLRGHPEPAAVALGVATEMAQRLDLATRVAWHTNRAPVTGWADALVTCSDAWGHIANDVLLLGRPEIGELAEAAVAGRGGSSAMPHKANPVLSVLIRRAALAAPAVAAQLHLSAASVVDERPDGGWHVEWSALASLTRHTLTAGSQVTELVAGLRVDADRMATNARSVTGDLLAESRSVAQWDDHTDQVVTDRLADHLGATDLLIDAALARTDPPEHP
ncbi:lyase family protein [Nocardioides sp.]|uniref:lyase family protein n=1 Tax=Nocardioides sp. TaxID=35761 RepID=UPI003D12B2D8